MEYTEEELDEINKHNEETAKQVSECLGQELYYFYLKAIHNKKRTFRSTELDFTWCFSFSNQNIFGIKPINFIEYRKIEKDVLINEIENKFARYNEPYAVFIIQQIEKYRLMNSLTAELQTTPQTKIKKVKIWHLPQ